MFTTRFGIEIEFTGITRETAARTAADYLGGTVRYEGTFYDTYTVTEPNGRNWSDTSGRPAASPTSLAAYITTSTEQTTRPGASGIS